MLTLLKNWKGAVEINGIKYNSVHDVISTNLSLTGEVNIKLLTETCKSVKSVNSVKFNTFKQEYRILVKPYMTKLASPEFDFMEKWNHNIPMPSRNMQGTIEKETRGMVYMKLHGFAKQTVTCTCCGRELTNPISRYYGVGPICLSKLGIPCEIDNIDEIKERLEKVEWEGWIIKSAIQEKEEV